MLVIGQTDAMALRNIAEFVAKIAERSPTLLLVISRGFARQLAIARKSGLEPADGACRPMLSAFPSNERGNIDSLSFNGSLFETFDLRLQALGHDTILPFGGHLSAVRPRKQAFDHP